MYNNVGTNATLATLMRGLRIDQGQNGGRARVLDDLELRANPFGIWVKRAKAMFTDEGMRVRHQNMARQALRSALVNSLVAAQGERVRDPAQAERFRDRAVRALDMRGEGVVTVGTLRALDAYAKDVASLMAEHGPETAHYIAIHKHQNPGMTLQQATEAVLERTAEISRPPATTDSPPAATLT